jgi:hypothetical protein
MSDSTNPPRRSWLKGLAAAVVLPLAGRMAAANPQYMGGHRTLPTVAPHVAGSAAIGTSPWSRPLTPTEMAALAAVSW